MSSARSRSRGLFPWAVVFLLLELPASAQTPPAFPGAEGFGAQATGGRGGQVIYVTNLNAGGPGSFQAALDTPGPRYILFKVSGVVAGIPHLTYDDVTIAGQTSPGGIIVRGFHTTEEPYCDQDPVCIQSARTAENWILRFLRSRPGNDGNGLDDGLRLLHTRRAIVDHLSIANATDEAVQISYANDITVQYTLLAETLGGHAQYGGMLLNYSDPGNGWELSRLSLHHNVWNRLMGRLPEISRESPDAGFTTLQLELSNNLIWDPNYFTDVANESYPGGGGTTEPIYYQLNFVGNHYQVRADHPYGAIHFPDPLPGGASTTYFSGNRMNLYPGYADYQLRYCCNDFPPDPPPGTPSFAVANRHAFPAISYDASSSLRHLLARSAGALPHDAMDRRLLAPLGTGIFDTAPRDQNPYGDAYLLPFPTGSPPPAPLDSDNDGMPNAWEIAHGLNPSVQDHNGTQLSLPQTGVAGYSNLEVYLNQLADQLIGGTTGLLFTDGFEKGDTRRWSATLP